MPRLVPFLACLFILACATTAPALRPTPGAGPPLYVMPNPTCSDVEPTAPGMIPDAELCGDLLTAIKRALNDAGYRIVERDDEPHAASVRVFAQQRSATDRNDKPTSFVLAQVMIDSAGEELERATADGNRADDGGEKAEVQSFASSIVDELVHSPRLRRAGLLPGRAPLPVPHASSQ
jgi:hypothetical protein